MEKRNVREKGVANNQISCHGKLDLESSTIAVLESKTINDLRGRSRIKYGMTSLWMSGQGLTYREEALNKNSFRAPLRSGFTLRPSSPRKVGMRGIGAVTHLYPALRHCGMTKCVAYGFTLIELLVVVLIIGILSAVAVPQYQKAVLKSRFSAMMPLAKALAESNEVYYLEHGRYSEDPTELAVQGKDTSSENYPDGTSVLMYSDEADLSFVRTENASIPNARYVAYQKHSANFAGTTMCEAESEDEKATWLCEKGLNGVLVEGGNSGNENGWVAYLLTGSVGTEDHFAAGDNGGQDEPGNEPGDEPQPLQCTGEQPAAINAPNGATGTATCVNGQWTYAWTGGQTYADCTGDSAYKCAGSTFSVEYGECFGKVTNGCAGNTFSGNGSACYGYVANGCADSTFSGNSSSCEGSAANFCEGSTFSGQRSYCSGNVANACAGTKIQAGAYCDPSSAGGCDGALYGVHPNKDSGLIGSCWDNKGYCPTGVPVRGSWNDTTQSYDISGWKGNCCNPAYMVSGECPSDIAICQ